MNEIKGFFDEYAKFVDDVTSEIGKKTNFLWNARRKFPAGWTATFPAWTMRWQVWPAKRERSETCGKAEIP